MREIILRVKFQRPASRRSLAARVEHCHWSEYVGMSLQERQATMQVMLGMSLRARWDASLVTVITVATSSAAAKTVIQPKTPSHI